MMVGAEPFRCGFVALLGRANVGKSTLVNRLVGTRIAITSPKPQTTRRRALGLCQRDNCQLILMDTPGLANAKAPLPRALAKAARTAAAEADVVAVIVAVHDGKPVLSEHDEAVLAAARRTNVPRLVVLNKIDLLHDKRSLLPWMATWAAANDSELVVPISARKDEGIEGLFGAFERLLPAGPPLFATDALTDQSERALAAEFVREQLLWQLQGEVPHAAAVVLETFDDGRSEPKAIVRLHARIIVERDGQKAIVIGHKGQTLKAIGMAARHHLERFFHCAVYLHLHVVVDNKWTSRPDALQDYAIGELTR